MSWKPSSGSSAKRKTDRPDDEREFADLGQASRNGQRDAGRVPGDDHDHELRHELHRDDQEQDGQDRQGIREDVDRVEQHPDRHEEQHGEGIAERERVRGRLVAHVRFAHDQAGEERAERERHPEHRRRDERDAQGDRKHGQREQLPRALPSDDQQQPRHDASARDDHDDGEHRGLPDGEDDGHERIAGGGPTDAFAAKERRDRGKEHEDEDRQEVLDDQPADRDPALRCLELVAVRQRSQEHDRARDRQREAEHEPAAQAPAEG